MSMFFGLGIAIILITTIGIAITLITTMVIMR